MWKTRNKRSLFPLKEKKTIINRVCYLQRGLFLWFTLHWLNGMNIIIQLKVQNHQNTFEATPTSIFLHGLSFQMLQKAPRSIIYCSLET